MMLPKFNAALRNGAPAVHGWLKSLAHDWMHADAPLVPAVRKVYGHWTCLHPFYLNREFKHRHKVIRWLDAYVSRGGVAFDIGAHVGTMTLPMARATGPKGRVLACEPSAANLKHLRYHVSKNRLAHVRVIEAAVSESHGGQVAFTLLLDGNSTSNSITLNRTDVPLADKAARSRREVLVDQVSVDGMCRDYSLVPDVLKIDVEGADLMVLRGATETLKAHRPTLILGIHPWWLPPGQTPDQIAAFLAAHGYCVYDEYGRQPKELLFDDYLVLPEGKTPISIRT